MTTTRIAQLGPDLWFCIIVQTGTILRLVGLAAGDQGGTCTLTSNKGTFSVTVKAGGYAETAVNQPLAANWSTTAA